MISNFLCRGFKEDDFLSVADFLDKAVSLAKEAQSSSKTLKEFSSALDTSPLKEKCETLRKEINAFASRFHMPGFDDH